MLCPNCGEQLSISERRGVEIDYRPACRGVWLDAGELDKIVERSAPPGGWSRGRADDRESWWERVWDLFD